jgi:hypothetical protein
VFCFMKRVDLDLCLSASVYVRDDLLTHPKVYIIES